MLYIIFANRTSKALTKMALVLNFQSLPKDPIEINYLDNNLVWAMCLDSESQLRRVYLAYLSNQLDGQTVAIPALSDMPMAKHEVVIKFAEFTPCVETSFNGALTTPQHPGQYWALIEKEGFPLEKKIALIEIKNIQGTDGFIISSISSSSQESPFGHYDASSDKVVQLLEFQKPVSAIDYNAILYVLSNGDSEKLVDGETANVFVKYGHYVYKEFGFESIADAKRWANNASYPMKERTNNGFKIWHDPMPFHFVDPSGSLISQ